jgi:very-short-patch-repair endonuclease
MLAASADSLVARCRAICKVLPPDAVITHLTSAAIRGWWLPQGIGFPIVACTDRDAVHLDRRGVYVRRCAIAPDHRGSAQGVPMASAAWTIVELAEHLALVDLVIAIDSALHLGHVTAEEIRATMVRGRRGVRVLRRALTLCNSRSESPWESILRLIHELSGIEVEPQYVVTNAANVFVARADLRIKGTRRLAEYDGSDHRSRIQHEWDLRREKRLSRLGYERFGYIAAEIMRDPGRVVRDAEDALGLPHNPRRAAGWMDEARRSSLYAAGRAALEGRLRRFDRTQPPRRVAQTGS